MIEDRDGIAIIAGSAETADIDLYVDARIFRRRTTSNLGSARNGECAGRCQLQRYGVCAAARAAAAADGLRENAQSLIASRLQDRAVVDRNNAAFT